MTRRIAVALVMAMAASGVGRTLAAQGRAGAPPAAAAPVTPKAQAPLDLTGQWVAIITEDWRWRMITPPKGDYASIPLTPEGKRVADLWDAAKDEAAGEQCRAYGAPGLMRGPTRLRISWLDDNTLKLETDYGMQTRLFRFSTAPANEAPSWQGVTAAQWVMAASGRRGTSPQFGSMKSMTTRLRPGYLRKNGVPYSANTVLTEYWDVQTLPSGDKLLVDTIKVDDPANLQMPWVTSMHFKKETDTSKWDPTPCNARF